MLTTLGARASDRWLRERGFDASPNPRWYVEITLHPQEIAEDATFELNLYPEEWGYMFRRGAQVSSIRITDVPFVHGRDEHRLLGSTPPLEEIGTLIALLEKRHAITFQRTQASVRSNLTRAASIVRAWLNTL